MVWTAGYTRYPLISGRKPLGVFSPALGNTNFCIYTSSIKKITKKKKLFEWRVWGR